MQRNKTRRSQLSYWVLRLILIASASMSLPAASYRIVQITTDPVDHRWPSINNRGDIVWSQKLNGNGNWQVFKKPAPATSQSNGVNIFAPDGPNHNYKYPAISDTGDIIYLRDNNTGNNGGSTLQVVKNRNNNESLVEFSSRNTLSGDHRDAGQHFGIAADGTTISYYDFSQSGLTRRRFNVNGVPIKEDTTGAAGDFSGKNYPGINSSGFYVYSDGSGIWKSPLNGGGRVRVDKGTDPALAPSVADGTDPVVVYIKSPQLTGVDIASGTVMSQKGSFDPVEVHRGSWASINIAGIIALEDLDSNNFRQIYLAYPLVQIIDPVKDLISNTAISVDLSVLASGGREVEGVAADGVARVVVRIDATGVDSANIEILDELNNAVTDSSIGGVISNRTGVGGGTSVTLTPETTITGRRLLLAIYRAPSRFVRSGSSDSSSSSRLLSLHVRLTVGGQAADLYSPINIVRPPILLVHGEGANSNVWSTFDELAVSNDRSRFYVNKANYVSDQGLQSAAQVVYQDLMETVQRFKTVKKVAAIQANVVAHGMGATVVRVLALGQNYLNDPASFSFGKGAVNKLITIAGIYQPAEMANYLSTQSCIQDVLSNSILSTPVWQQPSSLGVGTLRDLARESNAMCIINNPSNVTPFPVHAITGTASLSATQFLESFINGVGAEICIDLPRFNVLNTLGSSSDLFVSAASQTGFAQAATENIFGVVHSPPFSAPIASNSAETKDPRVVVRVIQLIDSVSQSDFSTLSGSGGDAKLCGDCKTCQGIGCVRRSDGPTPVSESSCCFAGATIQKGPLPSLPNDEDLPAAKVDARINELQQACKLKGQDFTVPHLVDGCSVPLFFSVLVDAGILDPARAVQDPTNGRAGLESSRFGLDQGKLINAGAVLPLPCNRHDICYQTLGTTAAECNAKMYDDMLAVCKRAYPTDTCPYPGDSDKCFDYAREKSDCSKYAAVYKLGVDLFGTSRWKQRQTQYGKCCQ